MDKYFYRFRPVDALLDHFHELKNQEIYFASPAELNDPMEGFRDVFWSGDSIAWKNLFRHYLRCLTRACALWCICGEEYPIGWDQIPILDPRLPVENPMPAVLLDEQIDKQFFQRRDASEYIEVLSARSTPVRRDELCTYIQVLHPWAVTTILSCYERAGLLQASKVKRAMRKALKNTFRKAMELARGAEIALAHHDRNEDVLIAMFTAFRYSNAQLGFIRRYNNDIDPELRNKAFLFFTFPDEYVEKIEKLLYPDWYTACFMSNCRDSALWAYYGDNHHGVCLQFKAAAESGRSWLPLERLCSISTRGPMRGSANHEFLPVAYMDSHVNIDFFRSLGLLPMPVLEHSWYSSESGERSICAADLFDHEDDWRERYWTAFRRSATTKLKDWDREGEHRLILHSSIIDFSDPMNRKLKYSFNSLEGIIFGMKTPLNKKIEICRLIEAKCRAEKRENFKFYQSYFSPIKGCIEYTEMSLLKFGVS